MNLPEKWLHIQSLGGDQWVKPIYTAMKNVGIGRSKELDEFGTAISDRLTFLPIVLKRLDIAEKNIYGQTNGYTKEYECTHDKDENEFPGYAINDSVKFEFIIVFDSLLFELNSVCELINKFIKMIYQSTEDKVHKHIKNDRFLNYILIQEDHDDEWLKPLVDIRNHFIHQSSPYFAIDISTSKYDILIMKENIKVFNDHKRFIPLSEIKEMCDGFRKSLPLIQKHLIKLLKRNADSSS